MYAPKMQNNFIYKIHTVKFIPKVSFLEKKKRRRSQGILCTFEHRHYISCLMSVVIESFLAYVLILHVLKITS